MGQSQIQNKNVNAQEKYDKTLKVKLLFYTKDELNDGYIHITMNYNSKQYKPDSPYIFYTYVQIMNKLAKENYMEIPFKSGMLPLYTWIWASRVDRTIDNKGKEIDEKNKRENVQVYAFPDQNANNLFKELKKIYDGVNHLLNLALIKKGIQTPTTKLKTITNFNRETKINNKISVHKLHTRVLYTTLQKYIYITQQKRTRDKLIIGTAIGAVAATGAGYAAYKLNKDNKIKNKNKFIDKIMMNKKKKSVPVKKKRKR